MVPEQCNVGLLCFSGPLVAYRPPRDYTAERRSRGYGVPCGYPCGEYNNTQDPHLCPPRLHVVVTDETAETASWAPSGPVRAVRAGGGARPVIRSTRTGPGRRHWFEMRVARGSTGGPFRVCNCPRGGGCARSPVPRFASRVPERKFPVSFPAGIGFIFCAR